MHAGGLSWEYVLENLFCMLTFNQYDYINKYMLGKLYSATNNM